MDYKYKGIELTPSIFAELMIQFYDGEQFSRKDAIKTITEYHLENGGILNKHSYAPDFKKATSKLQDYGITNIAYGIWKLDHNNSTVDIMVSNEKSEESFSADKVVGKGKNAVYLYYYDCYKELANLKGSHIWECKIVRTDVAPISRVFSQAETCYPELPHLALVINCDDSSLLEKTLHSILKLQGKWLDNAPGKDWFITSPEEIIKLYNLIK